MKITHHPLCRYIPVLVLMIFAGTGTLQAQVPWDTLAPILEEGENPLEGFQPFTYTTAAGKTLPYRLYVPAGYDSARSYPLVLFLHGGGSRGDNNRAQITRGSLAGTHIWTRPANQAEFPCFVLAPQCPREEMWGDPSTEELAPNLSIVLEIIGHLQTRYNLDRSRYYITGQSMGAIGTFAMITQRPGIFAAAVPVCGFANLGALRAMEDLPIWVFHGAADSVVTVSTSRSAVWVLKRSGKSPRYTEYEDVGHPSWNYAYREPELLPWLFSQRRGKDQGAP